MILLNLGCGYPRPGAPWTNVDTLDAFLSTSDDHGAPQALANLRAEPNYVERDLGQLPWAWEDDSVDGILCSHYFEHWDTQKSVAQMRECRRILKPGGPLRVSVPDAAYFRSVADRDVPENWMELYGENNHVGPEVAYRSVALFYDQHLQTYTEDALWCQLTEAGFRSVVRTGPCFSIANSEAANLLALQDNRQRFSLIVEAVK